MSDVLNANWNDLEQTNPNFMKMDSKGEPVLRALGFYIIVEIPIRVYAGSIILPDKSKQADANGARMGYVYDIGPNAFKGRRDNPSGEPWFKKGDKVFFPRYSGNKVETEDDRVFMFLTEENLTATPSPELRLKEQL